MFMEKKPTDVKISGEQMFVQISEHTNVKPKQTSFMRKLMCTFLLNLQLMNILNVGNFDDVR